ncbi:putative choline dehydrogenase [Chaetomium strumarium]|uniref:Choline dehydrogenase n=1 Tax=Chaetomium strumarium TaxID=1170767 RepID=A0AAJ0M330_9PEZI|nr:putative choline dehydrogenase [Chaetomium strumarium]
MGSPGLTAEEFAKMPFDFLIVGGGTAGLAVAARLSELPQLTVGVLEVGEQAFGDGSVDLPGVAGVALGTALDWQFHTVPQTGLDGRTVPWARGKVLGGSSALNYMTWNRAARQDYDDWRELGNPGWGWDDLLPFFKKSETFHEPSEATRKVTRVGVHNGCVGRDGPVQVSYPSEFTASHALWHRTLEAVGVKTNDSHLAGSNIGCWTSLVSVDPRNVVRSYAARAYYKPNAARPNLLVLARAEVREVLLAKRNDAAGSSWKAEGVRFIHDGAQFMALASREVIISAGSVQSPQILELSGIGSSAVLSAAGIPVKVDNPNVGENLQDHLTTTIVFEVDSSLRNPDDLKVHAAFAAAREEYARTRTGALTILPVSIAYVAAAHFVPAKALDTIVSSFPAIATSTSADKADVPNTERDVLLRRRFTSRSHELGHVEFIFDLGNWGIGCPSELLSPAKKYASMLQILQYPFSRGSVHIRPPPPPLSDSGAAAGAGDRAGGDYLRSRLSIDPQYFAGPHGALDLELALHAHRFAAKICATPPLASILRAQVWPPPEDSPPSDAEALRSWLRRVATTDWHPVGTCAMGGRGGARTGVVDARLRVYGVEGLRVADASVMPLQIGAHLQATVYAIAEKAAAMILEDHGLI